jgi:tRNA-dihydrouridine synthase B
MTKSFPKLSGKLVLAPMHNITNIAFRIMCKKYGASLVSTELLSANAIARKNNAVLGLADTCKAEKPIAVQIFSQNAENIVKAAKILEEKEFDIIDINFGCPSKKIMAQGSGGALLKRKNKIAEIVSEVSKSVSIPVSVKIRSGYDENSINAIEIAKVCENAGANAIIIHPRTVKQGYSGKADWNLIKEIKQNVKIPVIGNGDVFSGDDAKRMFDKTGCDYIMIGRGAIGNPFIFKQINHYLKTGEIIEQKKHEKITDYFEYIDLAKEFDIFSVKDAKLKAQEFTKGFSGSSNLRRELNKIKSWEEIEKAMGFFKSSL